MNMIITNDVWTMMLSACLHFLRQNQHRQEDCHLSHRNKALTCSSFERYLAVYFSQLVYYFWSVVFL